MAKGYVVRRGDRYHYRVSVPLDLRRVIGRSELRGSLGECSRRAATIRAASFVFISHRFFDRLRFAMTRLSPEQVSALIAEWLSKTLHRRREIVRSVELGLHRCTPTDFVLEQSDAADACVERCEKLLPAPASDPYGEEEPMPRPTPRVRQKALEAVAAHLTDDDEEEIGRYRLMDRGRFDALDELSKLDVARHFLLESIRVHNIHSADEADAALAATQPSATLPRPEPAASSLDAAPTLSEAWKLYCEDQRRTMKGWQNGIPEKPPLAYADLLRMFGDCPVRDLTREHARRFRDFQERRPVRRAPYNAMSAAELMSADVPDTHRQSGTNAKHIIEAASGFFAWCVKERMAPTNEFDDVRVDAKARATKALPWSDPEIQKLLDPTNLKEHSGIDPKHPAARRFYVPWMIAIATYTGARMGEVLGLRVSDFVAADPHSDGTVPVFLIDEYEGRRVKTHNSRRKIPIHPDLIELGLPELVERRRAMGATLLLDVAAISGKLVKSGTRHFGVYRKRLKLGAHRAKTFHSLRHTFKTRAKGYIDPAHVNMICGHDPGDGAPRTYEHRELMPVHREHEGLAKITFGLDLAGLRVLLAESTRLMCSSEDTNSAT